MKALVITIASVLFVGSFFVLKTMYNGGNNKGAERIIVTTEIHQENQGLNI